MTERRPGEHPGERDDFSASHRAATHDAPAFLHAHLSTVVQSADEIIVSKTLDGVVRSWNPGAERVFGFTAQEMIGQYIGLIIPPERQAEEAELLARLRAGNRIERYETTRVTRDGNRIDVSIGISPIRDEKGTIIGAVKIGHEISARRAAEAALREEAHALETLNRVGRTVAGHLDLASIVQAVTDAGTELSRAGFGAFFYNVLSEQNGSYLLYTLSGVPREAFARFPMPRNTAVFGPTFSGNGIVRSDDITQDPRYGKNAPYHGMPEGHLPVRSYLAVPVMSRSGEVLGGLFFGHPESGVFSERSERLVVALAAQAAIALDNARLYEGVQRELAARISAEEALRVSESELRKVLVEREQLLASERTARTEAERLSHLKDEFLATLSHELRTPLNSIQGWAALLRTRELDPADRAKGLETIERNVRVQTQLVDDLLDMSRIVSGKMRLELQQVHLHAVIEAAIQSISPSAEAKAVRVTKLLDSSIGPIRADPHRLQQVLWNLLSNAVKFTPKGGRIHIVLERVNSHAEIVVDDSGIGIKPEFLPHVFDRFRQADPSAGRRYSGLGLGLSIVKSLVELHGGSVRVKSPGEGLGTTFALLLPVPPVLAKDARHAVDYADRNSLDSIELPRLDGAWVLLVDDEPDGLSLAVRILEEQGARTLTATEGAQALELLRTHSVDVLVSDIGMPQMDGYALIRRVRELEGANALPAIALTAYARSEDRQRSLLAGYQMHITKPIEGRELIAGIATLMRLRRR